MGGPLSANNEAPRRKRTGYQNRIKTILDDLLLPEEVVEKMSREIHDAGCFDVEGSNHYGIVFQPHENRDQAIRGFLLEMCFGGIATALDFCHSKYCKI